MNELLFARGQMAMSLAFHIVFAAIGVAMPVLMVIAEIVYRRTGDAEWLAVAKAWAKGTAVMFAVGAVSGTVLSFELGLLFPGFMRHAGAIVGMPFSLEGFAFFLEAIFLGVYLYGWDRVSARAHVAAGVGVALSGLASLVFVMLVNAWMNAPVGFNLDAAGNLIDIDPIAALKTPYGPSAVIHMTLAAYMATGFAAAAIHAWVLLRKPTSGFHRKALAISLCVAIPCALVQPLSGHLAGHMVAKHQPMKLAAMESLYHTQARAPIVLLGLPDDKTRTVPYSIEIPGALSFIAFNDFNATVQGLEEFPEADWPSSIIHFAFQGMVGMGTLLAGLAAWAMFEHWRRRRRGGTAVDAVWLLRALVLAGPLGMLAIECGWIVTEVGRQPYVIYGVLRTAAAVTPMKGLAVTFVMFTLLYMGLAATVSAILWRFVKKSPDVHA